MPITALALQSSSSILTEPEKKIRNVEKKIRQIAELKERYEQGEMLELTQVCHLLLLLVWGKECAY